MTVLSQIFRTAAKELDEGLQEALSQAQPLKLAEVRRRFGEVGDYDMGWRATLPTSGAPVFILKPATYPERLIDVYVGHKSLLGRSLHITRSGQLCLGPPNAQHYAVNHLAASLERIEKADYLLSRDPKDFPEEEWRREIQAYWSHSSSGLITSLLSPNEPSRLLSAVFTNGYCYVADNESDLRTWLTRKNGQTRRIKFTSGALIWLDRPLNQSQTPKCYSDLLKLAPEAATLLEQLPKGRDDQSAVIIGFEEEGQPVLLGVALKPHLVPRGSSRIRQPVNQASREFRLRGEISQKITRCLVRRADSAWLTFRGGRAVAPTNIGGRERRVAILGCGSLGSGVAEVLAKSGVGHLTLVDPERLSYDNVARHALGIQWVGENKANALRTQIQRALPHISCTAIGGSWSKLDEKLASFDLIISTMALWQENLLLNRVSIHDSIRPIIYAWLEPHAMAAHAVCIRHSRACLECGFTPEGKPRLVATQWAEPTWRHEAGCGGVFQPYGALDLLPAHYLVAELALELLAGRVSTTLRRSWIGDSQRVSILGGRWSEEWEEVEPIGQGNQRLELPWKKDPSCPACGRKPALTRVAC
jgi:molybdopterin/thiamine biosynthesis adenylyltransferase